MNKSIVIHELSKSFGTHRVIRTLSLTLEPGTIFGLVGLNGAGKTTFLRLLLGLLKPDSGTISIGTFTPWNHSKAFYRTSGVVLENDGYWNNLSVLQNCSIYSAAKGMSKDGLTQYIDQYWKNSEIITSNKKVKHLSRGQRMQCALFRAFLGNPRFFFLDEPVIALDLHGYNHFKNLISTVRKQGAIVIISSHQLDTIDELCTRVGILHNGSINEISRHPSPHELTNWYIDMDHSDHAHTILEQCNGFDITYKDGFYFSLTNSRQIIPEIIRQLTAAGISVREVKHVDSGLSTVVQKYYGQKDEIAHE